jgi:hypothetical protein
VDQPAPKDAAPPDGRPLVALIALVKLGLHLAVNASGGYGLFRDEFYYVACSRRLAAGYVDLPPLSMFVLALERQLFGDSLFAIRLFPALAGAGMVFLTGVLARRLGAGRFGQCLAALAALCSPINLAFGTYFSMNAFDLLIWTAAACLFVSVLQAPQPRTWLALGVLLGLGLLNKIGVSWLGIGLFAGLLLTPHRAQLRTKWPWIAAAIALVLFLPFIVWNVEHEFAHLEFIRNATSGKYSGLSAWTFVSGLFPINQPISAPLWILGLCFYFGSARGAMYRPLGIAFVVACVILMINGHSKSEYLAAGFPMLYAGGGAMVDAIEHAVLRWLKPTYAAVLVATTVLILPMALPVLPVETYIRYAEKLGVAPDTSEGITLAKLPQFYADMFGWKEKADTVAAVYERLSPDDKRDCAIFASNYGRCGAIDFFGRAHHLPDCIGDHNNYWLWGTRGHTGKLVIVLARDLGENAANFESVEVAAVVPHNEYCLPYENGLSVFVCRGLKVPLADIWGTLKHFQ